MPPMDIRARIQQLKNNLPKTCDFYDLPFKSDGQNLRLLHLHFSRYNQPAGAPAQPTVPVVGPEGSVQIPDLTSKFGSLYISGVHGVEHWAPEFLMDVAELLADAIDKVQNGNNPQPFTVRGYTLNPGSIKDIVKNLDLYFLPVVNPWGRARSNRHNANDFDLNRNFPFLWKRYAAPQDYYTPAAAGNVDASNPGTGPASEVETKAVMEVLYALPVNLFVDCHSRITGSALYPWACDGTQTTDRGKSAFVYNPGVVQTVKQADGVDAPPAYNEYLPPTTQAKHVAAGGAIRAATGQASTPQLPAWVVGNTRSAALPGGFGAMPYIGVSDDFAMSLDICNMLAFTFEVVELPGQQPAVGGQYQTGILSLLDWYAQQTLASNIQRPMSRDVPKAAQWAQPQEDWGAYRAQLSCYPQPPGGGGGTTPPPSGGGGGGSGSGGGGGGCGSLLIAPVFLMTGLVLLLIFFQITVRFILPAGPVTYALDHYKVYDVRDVPLQGEKGPGRPVFTEGQFDVGAKPGTLTAVTHFANPALKTLHGEGTKEEELENEEAHLTWYKLEETVDEPRRRVVFTNQFGEDQVIVIGNAKYLLLPTSKLHDRPPDAFPEDIDHYKAYEVLEAIDVETGIQVKIEDQFGWDEGAVVGEIAYFAVPADKFLGPEMSSPGLINPEDHLAIYEIPKERGPVPPFKTKDQFQDHPGFQVLTSEFLCVPSRKSGYEVVAPGR